MLYHKLDPSSTSETEKFVAWTNVYFSETYFCISRFVCAFTLIIKNSKFTCLIDKESEVDKVY